MSTADVALTPAAAVAEATLTPAEEVCALVAGAAALFYWAEKDHNPGVKDYWDALHYVSTSLSVGYANLFPMTPLGKLLASALMTVGPALAGRTLDGARTPEPPIAEKLDQVIAELRRLNEKLAP